MSALRKEVSEYDDFLLLDIAEEYSKLPYKTLAFFKAAYALYDCDFYVKADDDIYLRPDRLSLLLAKERPHSQTYLGCMKKGPVFTDPKLKCFRMFSNEDVTIGSWMLAMNVDHEDSKQLCEVDCTPSSIAVWDIPSVQMKTIQKHIALLQTSYSSKLTTNDNNCFLGLCNPEKKMLELHSRDICSKSSTLPSDGDG
ncbi:UNVERIFIED_CONTAM: putative beta-1,3-galactosyltransferase 14 [Sesamum radiatum]|uniref:Hexosyltransferase n=1 Tax=Sesamum radiatum TaxID=300843 RepID=A0AAW2K5L2_SESRA